MPRHLHPEAGGDPSQGPVREFANEPPSPGAGNDFPDVPAANRPSEDRENDSEDDGEDDSENDSEDDDDSED